MRLKLNDVPSKVKLPARSMCSIICSLLLNRSLRPCYNALDEEFFRFGLRIMSTNPISAFEPRKTPIQARSAVTVEAISEATIQVLLSHGTERLTTTRIAERAGVSVGTLYQYYPNKQSLLFA